MNLALAETERFTVTFWRSRHIERRSSPSLPNHPSKAENMGNSASESAKELVPFTGYYSLDEAVGAFLLIDTQLIYQNDGGGVTITHAATVTLCTDGIESSVYTLEYPHSEIYGTDYCTFVEGELIVHARGERIVQVHLARDFSNGNSSALHGTILGQHVNAVTPFSPIQMPVFAAKYYALPWPATATGSAAADLSGKGLAEPIPTLEIKSDGSLLYDDGGGLVQVDSYTYDYAMFVISFPYPKPAHVFEMGTTPGFGRVAGNAAKSGLFASVFPVIANPAASPSTEAA